MYGIELIANGLKFDKGKISYACKQKSLSTSTYSTYGWSGSRRADKVFYGVHEHSIVAFSQGTLAPTPYRASDKSLHAGIYTFANNVDIYVFEPYQNEVPPSGYGAVIYNEMGGVAWHSQIPNTLRVVGYISSFNPSQPKYVRGYSPIGRKIAFIQSGSDYSFEYTGSDDDYLEEVFTTVVEVNSNNSSASLRLNYCMDSSDVTAPGGANREGNKTLYMIIDVTEIR